MMELCFMPDVGHPEATASSNAAGICDTNLEMTMETTRRAERRKDRHARRLNQRSIERSGHPSKVGSALGVTRSAACHWKSDREHPVLRDAFAVLLRLDAHPEVSGRAFAEAVSEAVELSEIVHAEDDVLIARGLWLMDTENTLDAVEDGASMLRPTDHAEALRRHASAAAELAAVLDELAYREIDLHRLYFESKAVAA